VSAFAVILLVLAVVVVLLVVGGFVAAGRRARADRAQLLRLIERANTALADAHAEDNGWDLERLQDAAHHAFAEGAVDELHLIQVIDRPGTDADEAVFRVRAVGGGWSELTLARTGDAWRAK
jgi:hypothetical protein